ncbi:hypothetical protein [Corynebacterium sp. CCM 9204]|uniref:hypothetical protein n=1 Tax=Corynebacterium sp. CCM 9204 TaxID=3057616 RepID=UPI003525B8E5
MFPCPATAHRLGTVAAAIIVLTLSAGCSSGQSPEIAIPTTGKQAEMSPTDAPTQNDPAPASADGVIVYFSPESADTLDQDARRALIAAAARRAGIGETEITQSGVGELVMVVRSTEPLSRDAMDTLILELTTLPEVEDVEVDSRATIQGNGGGSREPQ